MCKKLIVIAIFILLVGPAYAQPEGLVAHWPMDEGTGTTAFDATGNGNDGVFNGDPQWVPGKIGGALELDGDGDYLNCGNNDMLNLTEQITVACWAKIPNFDTSWQAIVTNGDGSWRVHRSGSSNNIAWGTTGLTPLDLTGTTAVNDDEWHHIAGVFNGEQKILYIDGAVDASSDSPGTITAGTAHDINIGENNQQQGRHLIGTVDDVMIYSRGLLAEEILKIMEGLSSPDMASLPVPEHESTDIWRDQVLEWKPGEQADTHDIYLGTVMEDVNDATRTEPGGVLISQGQSETSLDPGRLMFDTTYYWRVDEVNAPSSPGTHRGEIWSFTTEPLAYPITNITATASSFHGAGIEPEKTIDGSGLDANDLHSTSSTDMWLTSATDTERWIQYEFDKVYKMHEMWVWNQNQSIESFIGFGAKDVTVEISTDGENWTPLADVPEFTKAPGLAGYAHNTTVDFGGQMVKFVKLTVNSPWGMLQQTGLGEVRFYYKPVLASYPEPAQGSMTDSIDVTLQWRPGREADQHEVVLSEDEAAVADNSAVLTTTSNNGHTPGPLNYSTTYFWRINDMNSVSTPPRYDGNIWSFTATDYLVLDDFEMYEDAEFLEIWAFWLDGYEDDSNGSTVGNGNIGETSITYQGGQSMPLHYDLGGAAIAEATYTFDTPMDWTRGEPNTLSLQLRGNPAAFQENTDGSISVGGAGADIWGDADDFRFVYKSLSGDGSITAKVEDFVVIHDWAKAGVMIRESTTPESSYAFVCTTGVNGTRYQYRLQAFTGATQNEAVMDGIQQTLDPAPVWIKIERVGNEFNGYYAIDEAVLNWVPMGENPIAITMVPEVLVGLAVTSHTEGTSTVATFSNVTTTGASGAWTTEAIGGSHPSNDPAPMYVVVTDSSNNEKVIPHPNPDASAIPTWEEWAIPLGNLSPVNLSRVASVTIGLGERGGSATGDQGTTFIDLLRIGTPLPVVEEPNEPNEPQL